MCFSCCYGANEAQRNDLLTIFKTFLGKDKIVSDELHATAKKLRDFEKDLINPNAVPNAVETAAIRKVFDEAAATSIASNPKDALLDPKEAVLDALRYGYAARNGIDLGGDKEPLDPVILKDQFKAILEKYKNDQDLFPGKQPIDKNDEDLIAQIAREFPHHLARLIERHKGLSTNSEGVYGKGSDPWTYAIVKFCFRSRQSPEVAFKFPGEMSELIYSHMDKKMIAMPGKGVVVQAVEGANELALHLLIEGEYHVIQGDAAKAKSIKQACWHDSSQPAVEKKISKIYAQARGLNASYEEIGFVHEKGWVKLQITNFGEAPLPSFSKPDECLTFFEKLPESRNLNQEEMLERYGLSAEALNGKEGYITVLSATRGSADLSVTGSHGYLELVFPYEEETGGTRYKVIPIGLQADHIPHTSQGLISTVAATSRGVVHWPDESIGMLNRQRGGIPYMMDKAQMEKICASLIKETEKARKGELFFSWQAENCVHFGWKTVIGVLGLSAMDQLEKLCVAHPQQIAESQHVTHTLLRRAYLHLDSPALDNVMNRLFPAILDPQHIDPTGEILPLFEANFKVLENMLLNNGDLSSKATEVQIAIQEARALLNGAVVPSTVDLDEAKENFEYALKDFMKGVMKSEQFLKTSIYEAKYTGFLSGLMMLINWMPQWLSNFFATIFMFLLGSMRGQDVIRARVKMDGSVQKEEKYHSLYNSPEGQNKVIHHPAQIFNYKEITDRNSEVLVRQIKCTTDAFVAYRGALAASAYNLSNRHLTPMTA